MTKVHLSITPSQAPEYNGVGQIIRALWRWLPQFGIELTDAERADVIACQIVKGNLPRVDVLHCHGLMWEDLPHAAYSSSDYRANKLIIEAAREAKKVTVPSRWVGEAFRRDMRLSPLVIGHGIEFAAWRPAKSLGYILWNKGRNSDVCDPMPAWELARRWGLPVLSTFAPIGREAVSSMKVIGTQPFETMKQIIQAADIYLATTPETFGIGTLEAMAAGVPVLGYDWGGTSDIVKHKINGYLVRPGDVDGLREGYDFIHTHRAEMSDAARRAARYYDWPKIVELYAYLYSAIARGITDRDPGVTIVITNHDYAKYLPQAIESAREQSLSPAKIILVDDASTDGSRKIIEEYAAFWPGLITTIYFDQNAGVAAARNAGIAVAETEFVCCLDADDMLHSDFIKAILPTMRANRQLGIGYSGLTIIDENGKEKGQTGFPPQFNWEIQTQPTTPPSNCIPSACIFRKEMWERAGGVRQEYAPGEDAEFWTRGLSVGFDAYKVTPDALFLYRVHNGSASKTKTYIPIFDRMPWMLDRHYPIGAPANYYHSGGPKVNSYAFPTVSVIIPVGPGHQKYLHNALDSLIGQTMRNWEAVVVNDTGKSLPRDIYDQYPFIHEFRSDARSAGAARNIGLDAARAPLVLFLDADDWLASEALAHMIAAYSVHNGRYIYSDWNAVWTETGRVEKQSLRGYNQFSGYLQHAVTVLMDTEFARSVRFDEALQTWEDWDFFLRCAIKGICGFHVAEPLLYYRVDHDGRRRLAGTPDDPSELAKPILEKMGRLMKETEGGNMSGCCGGDAASNSIMAAKEALGMIPKQQNLVGTESVDTIRMEFIGENIGALTFTNPANGHAYRGGRLPDNRYIDADKEDVAYLLGTGRWRSVSMPSIPVARESAPPIPQSRPSDEMVAAMNAGRPMPAQASTQASAQASSPSVPPPTPGSEGDVQKKRADALLDARKNIEAETASLLAEIQAANAVEADAVEIEVTEETDPEPNVDLEAATWPGKDKPIAKPAVKPAVKPIAKPTAKTRKPKK